MWQRTLLIDLPFQSLSRPNIGLSLIRAVLLAHGFPCDIRYANLDFAKIIGPSLYAAIAEKIPHDHLFGDLIFARAAGRCAPTDDAAPEGIPHWLWRRRDALARAAEAFIETLSREVVAQGYDVFGFNLMFQSLPSVALAGAIKARDPAKITVLGGAQCEGPMGSALHRAFPAIDYVCRGEGERLVVELYAHLSAGKPAASAIPGLVWRDAGASRENAPRALPVDDLDTLPSPVFDDWLAQLAASGIAPAIGRLALPIETSRGCWYGQKNHCIFCGLSGASLAYRAKSPRRALDDLAALTRHGIDSVFAVDLIFPNPYFKSLLPELRARGWPISIFYEIKANLRREQLVALKDAGIDQLQPGIESLSSRILAILQKGVSAYQNLRLLKWAAELGIGLEWNLLVDVPGAEPADYEEMARLLPLIVHLRPPTGGCSRVRIDRFSPLEYRARDFGVAELRPAPAYRRAFGLDDVLLRDLAYFFESTWPRSPDGKAAIGALEEATARWYRTKGKTTFVALSDGDDALWLFDCRPCATVDADRLSGFEKRVFDLCDGGATLEQIAVAAAAEPRAVARALARFVDRRWMVFIDGRYLSLPTNLDHVMSAAEFPPLLLGPVAHSIQRARMQPTWATISAGDAEDLARLEGAFATADQPGIPAQGPPL